MYYSTESLVKFSATLILRNFLKQQKVSGFFCLQIKCWESFFTPLILSTPSYHFRCRSRSIFWFKIETKTDSSDSNSYITDQVWIVPEKVLFSFLFKNIWPEQMPMSATVLNVVRILCKFCLCSRLNIVTCLFTSERGSLVTWLSWRWCRCLTE